MLPCTASIPSFPAANSLQTLKSLLTSVGLKPAHYKGRGNPPGYDLKTHGFRGFARGRSMHAFALMEQYGAGFRGQLSAPAAVGGAGQDGASGHGQRTGLGGVQDAAD